MRDFLMQKNLITLPVDSHAYPGLEHAAVLILEIVHPSQRHLGPPSMPISPYGEISRHQRETLLEIMNDKLATAHMADTFDVSQIVANRWKIQSVLVGAEGCSNPGIYLVQDMHDPTPTTYVMELLPTEAMSDTNGNSAYRKINLVHRLQHPNILEFYSLTHKNHINLATTTLPYQRLLLIPPPAPYSPAKQHSFHHPHPYLQRPPCYSSHPAPP
jgi:hypothetical protein